jgi:hypothetical protein
MFSIIYMVKFYFAEALEEQGAPYPRVSIKVISKNTIRILT